MLLENVRFTDGQAGDVEVDLLLFLADCGIATIEVKGGQVEYTDGEWWSVTSRGRRRTRPIEQARRAKHAIRSYLGRRTEWNYPLANTEWFVALPNTKVHGDMGPEGRREQLLGADDLDSIVDRIRVELANTAKSSHIPAAADIELALALLRNQLNALEPSQSESKREAARGLLIGIPLVASGVGYVLNDHGSIAVGSAIVASAVIGGTAMAILREQSRHRLRWGTLGGVMCAMAVIIGVGVEGLVGGRATAASQCQPGYTECLPIVPDLDCSQVTGTVTVTGVDVYRLDADGDGIGCEWNVDTPAGTNS